MPSTRGQNNGELPTAAKRLKEPFPGVKNPFEVHEQAPNELPIDQLHTSLHEPTSRGCFSGERAPETDVIDNNSDVYVTREVHKGYGASSIVDGAPSSGTRYLQSKERVTKEADFWRNAQPMVSEFKGPQPTVASESEYWSARHQAEAPPRGCGEPRDERACVKECGVSTEYKHHVGSGVTSAVDMRRNCQGPGWGFFGFNFSSSDEAKSADERMTEQQFWGQAKSHGVNDVPTRDVRSRWEQEAMTRGTLSTEEYKDVVHQVPPAQQGDSLPAKGQVDGYWAASDIKSRTGAGAKIQHAPERSCWPTPGGGYNEQLVGKVAMKNVQ